MEDIISLLFKYSTKKLYSEIEKYCKGKLWIIKEAIPIRNPNKYGTIKKLNGKRRKPFGVYVTTEYKSSAVVPDISFLEGILSEETYSTVQAEYAAYLEKLPLDESMKGKQVQKCIGCYATRQEAMIALAEHNKNPISVDKMGITFEGVYDVVKQQMAGKVKMGDSYAYKAAYAKCESLCNMRMRDIRLAHLQAVLDSNSKLSMPSLTNIVTIFKAVYKYALENDIVEKDYSQFVKKKSEAESASKSPFTREEVDVLWKNLDWLAPNRRKNLFTNNSMVDSIIIMIYTGVRIGELLSIKKEDVHLKERWIDLNGTKTKAAQRIVPIHTKLIPLIQKRMDMKGEYLISGINGEHVDYESYKSKFFVRFLEEFKMAHTPHECRHTFASISAASGMNPVLRKKILGHAANDITDDIYTHAYIEDLVKEIDKFNL